MSDEIVNIEMELTQNMAMLALVDRAAATDVDVAMVPKQDVEITRSVVMGAYL